MKPKLLYKAVAEVRVFVRLAYAVLPYAMSRLTWYGGIPMLLLSIGTVYYCSMLTVRESNVSEARCS